MSEKHLACYWDYKKKKVVHQAHEEKEWLD